jgi:hypothetical protein
MNSKIIKKLIKCNNLWEGGLLIKINWKSVFEKIFSLYEVRGKEE